MKTIGIIGGGPAGAMASARLARSGARALVFEERMGWEKPCGGGVSAKALQKYPFLLEADGELRRVRDAEFVASNGTSVRLRLRRPLAIYSRSKLNQLLLNRARQAGAEIIHDRIVTLVPHARGWKLEGLQGSYVSDFLVLAAGARSRLRAQLAGNLRAGDFMLTFGHYVPGEDSLLRVQFFQDLEGYAWAFPRPDHLSVGICGKIGQSSMPELRERLRAFVRTFGYAIDHAPIFSHLLPALRAESWGDQRLAGPGWALVGDCAGLVDPLTGEGIYYAMRSGELVAECLLEGFPASYPLRVWRELGRDLAHGARLAGLFYRGNVLGGTVSTRMVELAACSPAVGELLEDLVEGAQPYATLLARLYRAFAASLPEIATRSLNGSFPHLRSAES